MRSVKVQPACPERVHSSKLRRVGTILRADSLGSSSILLHPHCYVDIIIVIPGTNEQLMITRDEAEYYYFQYLGTVFRLH